MCRLLDGAPGLHEPLVVDRSTAPLGSCFAQCLERPIIELGGDGVELLRQVVEGTVHDRRPDNASARSSMG